MAENDEDAAAMGRFVLKRINVAWCGDGSIAGETPETADGSRLGSRNVDSFRSAIR
jgi:hypothetical protein